MEERILVEKERKMLNKLLKVEGTENLKKKKLQE